MIEPIIYDADLEIQYTLFKMQLKMVRDYKHFKQQDISDLTNLSTKCISDLESTKQGNPTLKSIIKYLDCMGYELSIEERKL